MNSLKNKSRSRFRTYVDENEESVYYIVATSATAIALTTVIIHMYTGWLNANSFITFLGVSVITAVVFWLAVFASFFTLGSRLGNWIRSNKGKSGSRNDKQAEK